MNEATHAYCENCRSIQEVRHEGLDSKDVTGNYLGGDVCCNTCNWIVATMYRKKEA